MSLYDTAQVERLMPCIWNRDMAVNGIPNPLAPPHDMPKGSPPNPSHAGTHMVHVADLQKAWRRSDLSAAQRQVLFLRFGLDSLLVEIAGDLDIHPRTARRRLDFGLGKMVAFMNGRTYRRPMDTDYGYTLEEEEGT